MPAIELRNICKRYQQTPVLQDASLSIGDGQRWALIGQSGVGKTTLLRIICGLEQADAGELLIDGRNMLGHPPHQRQAALVTQDYPLYPHLTVDQNLTAALQGCRLSASEKGARIEESLRWFQIEALRQRLPSQLSGGQAQRVALARALVRRPALLLLDEPLSQVDGLWRTEIRELILAAVRQYATNLIVVTHDPQDALLMADHIAVVDRQTIVQQGPALEVYQQPVSRIAAELLSPFGINWLPLASLSPQLLQLPGAIPAGKTTLGIRVDQLRVVAPSYVGEEMLSLTACVTMVHPCGFATLGEASLIDIDIRGTGGQQTGVFAGETDIAIKLLDWNNTLHLGEVRLAAPLKQCVWL